MTRYLPLKSRLTSVIVIMVASAVIGVGGWIIYTRVLSSRPGVEPDPSIFTVRGVDLSSHNGDVDFEALKADDTDFVLLKATEGTDFKDRNFVDNFNRARRAGLKVGAYHFFRFDTDGYMQALNFLHSLRGRTLDFEPIIDIEEWGNPDAIATSAIIKRLRDMIATLEEHGYQVMLYTNKDGYDRFIKGNFDSNKLWLCSFSEIDATIKWDIWQYTHRGSRAGVSGHVDLNTLSPVEK